MTVMHGPYVLLLHGWFHAKLYIHSRAFAASLCGICIADESSRLAHQKAYNANYFRHCVAQIAPYWNSHAYYQHSCQEIDERDYSMADCRTYEVQTNHREWSHWSIPRLGGEQGSSVHPIALAHIHRPAFPLPISSRHLARPIYPPSTRNEQSSVLMTAIFPRTQTDTSERDLRISCCCIGGVHIGHWGQGHKRTPMKCDELTAPIHSTVSHRDHPLRRRPIASSYRVRGISRLLTKTAANLRGLGYNQAACQTSSLMCRAAGCLRTAAATLRPDYTTNRQVKQAICERARTVAISCAAPMGALA